MCGKLEILVNPRQKLQRLVIAYIAWHTRGTCKTLSKTIVSTMAMAAKNLSQKSSVERMPEDLPSNMTIVSAMAMAAKNVSKNTLWSECRKICRNTSTPIWNPEQDKVQEQAPSDEIGRNISVSPDASTQLLQLGRIRIRTERGSLRRNGSRSSSLS